MSTILNKEEQTPFLNLRKIRDDFPILSRSVNKKPLVYADNAATTQKPQSVIDRLSEYYSDENANVHRGIHTLSECATEAFEESRRVVQRFLNAKSVREIVFTRGTTEAINLVAQSYALRRLKAGEEIIISTLEHHSNIVPWQIVCQRTGAKLKIAPVNDAGELIFEEYEKLVNKKTKLVALTHISNALGTVNPVQKLTKVAKEVGAVVLIDGAQSIIHAKIDVQAIGCDFYVFSGHKALGPTGIGVLYGREDVLQSMEPWQGGGDMIKTVSFEETTYNEIPYKFEAGTPNIAGAIGLSEALNYFSQFDLERVEQHEHCLLNKAIQRALSIPNLQLVGTAKNKSSICSFVVEGVHPNDLGTLLDQQGVAIRSGHHCAMPLMSRLNVPGTARASFAFYNSPEDVDRVFDAVEKALFILAA